MFSSRGTVRYEERGQGYCDVEKVGKHCCRRLKISAVYTSEELTLHCLFSFASNVFQIFNIREGCSHNGCLKFQGSIYKIISFEKLVAYVIKC